MIIQTKTPMRLDRFERKSSSVDDRSLRNRSKIPVPIGLQDKNNLNSTYKIGASEQNQNNRIRLQKNPSKVGKSSQITFRGFSMQNLTSAKQMDIAKNVQKKGTQILKDSNPKQYELFENFIDDFAKELKSDKKFREKFKFTDDQAKALNKDNILALPERPLWSRLGKAIVQPFVSLGKGVVKLVFDNDFGKKNFTKIHNYIQKDKKQAKLTKDYKNVVGLFNSVEKWENQFRKRYGVNEIKSGEEFMMGDDNLKRNLRCRSFELIDPNKGSYSTKALSVGNRAVSGVIGSLMYGVDAYNTTMRLSDDKETSAREGRVKFTQQMIRIGLASYFTATAFGVFKKQTNKSMGKALGLAGAMVVASEVLGRKLVGKRILPTTKEKLEQIEQENQTNPNMIVKFGRVLSGENKPLKKEKEDLSKIQLNDKFIKRRYGNLYSFGSESSSKVGVVNFAGGLASTPKVYKKQELVKMMDLVDQVDKNLGDYFKDNILKSLVSSKKLTETEAKKPFGKAIDKFDEIQVGKHSTRQQRLKKVLLAPVNWVKNLFVKPYKWVKNMLNGKEKVAPDAEIKKLGLEKDFKKQLEIFKKSKVYKAKSSLSNEKKVEAFAQEFLFLKDKGFEQEIQGVQNSLEWLKKNVKTKDNKKDNVDEVITEILKNKNKPEVKKHLENIGNKMNEMSVGAYSRDFADYDSAKYSVANNYTARILSTLFLVFDTYNLTMLHSNDKAKAVDNGSQRATQEITRTVMSSYLIHATNTVFHKFHNATIAGAMTLTAASSGAVNVLSRFAVGKPIKPTSKQELIKQEEKNKRNPLLNVTSAMVGKSMKEMDYGKSKSETSKTEKAAR